MKVAFTEAAKLELRQARDHYNGITKGLGKAFTHEVRELVTRIKSNTLQFPVVESLRSRRALCDRFPYMVVFLVHQNTAHILAIAHQHREPGYWVGRS